MNNHRFVILELAVRHLKPAMILFSVFILFRGHNYPGGGFIAALMAGSGMVLEAITRMNTTDHKRLSKRSVDFISSGLSIILLSAITGPLAGKPILTGLWGEIDLPLLPSLKAGTPLLFDTGVYFIVTGVMVIVFIEILEELEWK